MKHLFCETRRIALAVEEDVLPNECPICNGQHATIEIDELVYPIIDIFNKMGYHTDYSCSSHIGTSRYLKPQTEDYFYICFETIFIDDLIEYNEEMEFEDIVNQFRGKLTIFSIDPYNSDGGSNNTKLEPKDLSQIFELINGLQTVKDRPFDMLINHNLYYTWTWRVEHCFYKTKEHCGYRPTISLVCLDREEDDSAFLATKSHYKYMSDLCAILSLLEYYLSIKLKYRVFRDTRYKPELRDVEDGYYVASITDFDDIKSAGEREDELLSGMAQ